jgi:hypothetical protein
MVGSMQVIFECQEKGDYLEYNMLIEDMFDASNLVFCLAFGKLSSLHAAVENRSI